MARTRKKSSRTTFPIVGIGASAGGLEAMSDLLKHLPGKTGVAFVLVQHLDPSHESAMVSLLARMTDMPVSEAKNNVALGPNHFYVLPPNKLISLSRRRLKLSPRKDPHLPVDEFFRTLADEEGHRAIGVILSGNGSDGTEGCRAIKAAGGISFAQDEKSAKYPGMPASAVGAGCVDFVLPPERIARELAHLAEHPYMVPDQTETDEPSPTREHQMFGEIFAMLRQRTGVDFSQHKHATLQRRIHRRMVLHKLSSFKEYTEYLSRHGGEVQELFGDILIHVTGFFRDPGMFTVLKKKSSRGFSRDGAPTIRYVSGYRVVRPAKRRIRSRWRWPSSCRTASCTIPSRFSGRTFTRPRWKKRGREFTRKGRSPACPRRGCAVSSHGPKVVIRSTSGSVKCASSRGKTSSPIRRFPIWTSSVAATC